MRTDRDWASKEWLRNDSDDGFQLISPDLALFLLIVGVFVGLVFERFL